MSETPLPDGHGAEEPAAPTPPAPRARPRRRPPRARVPAVAAVAAVVVGLLIGVLIGYVARGGAPDAAPVTQQRDVPVVTVTVPATAP